MGNVIPFNPLDKRNLAISVGNALSDTNALPLSNLEQFEGSGVYSLYYMGDFTAYKPLADANKVELAFPIYVGKADSRGKRKGGFIEDSAAGTALFKRLSDHAKSIRQATNLNIDDFYYRFLVVDDLWIPLGESLLISKHAPVWNALVEGFGNHDPGKSRYQGMRPLWDMLHPGRPWAAKLQRHNIAAEQIASDALQYLTERYAVINDFSGRQIPYTSTNLPPEPQGSMQEAENS